VSQERILAIYRIETPHPLEYAAAVMAGEQSTGTFIRVPGETEALRERFAARVERLTEIETVEAPTLPYSQSPRHVFCIAIES
jgi:ribulose-bisphosphate carboxylase large chain